MREKVITRGTDALADDELLEMLLFLAFRQGDTKPTAKAVINRFGSFAKVLSASERELLRQRAWDGTPSPRSKLCRRPRSGSPAPN